MARATRVGERHLRGARVRAARPTCPRPSSSRDSSGRTAASSAPPPTRRSPSTDQERPAAPRLTRERARGTLRVRPAAGWSSAILLLRSAGAAPVTELGRRNLVALRSSAAGRTPARRRGAAPAPRRSERPRVGTPTPARAGRPPDPPPTPARRPRPRRAARSGAVPGGAAARRQGRRAHLDPRADRRGARGGGAPRAPALSREWTAERRFVLTVGNAGGIEIDLNGRRCRPSGAKRRGDPAARASRASRGQGS